MTDFVKCEEPKKGGGVCGEFHHNDRKDDRCDLHRPPERKAKEIKEPKE